jgi:flavodoxin
MTKILIVYYSLTGNTKFIAEKIRSELNSDILPLKPIKQLKANSGMRYFWGGFQAYMNKKPKLEDYTIKPEEYDLLVLGTPVWAWRYSPPIHSFINNHDLSGKNVALWMCYAGDGVKAMQKFKELLENTNIIAETGFQDPMQKGEEEVNEKAIEFTKQIMKRVNEMRREESE